MKRQIEAASGPAKRNKLSKCTLKLPLTVIKYSLQWLIPTNSEDNCHIKCCIQLQAFVTAVSFESLATWHKSLQLGHLKSEMLENRLELVWQLSETAETEANKAKKLWQDAEEAAELTKQYHEWWKWEKSAVGAYAKEAKENFEKAETAANSAKAACREMNLLYGSGSFY